MKYNQVLRKINSNVYEATDEGFVWAARRLTDTGYITEEQLIQVEENYRRIKRNEALQKRLLSINDGISKCNRQIDISRSNRLFAQLGLDYVGGEV